MPFDGSAGHGPSSEVKQEHFRVIVGYHMAGTYGGVMQKYRREGWKHHPFYLYWDLHAGPGRYADGRLGSPLIVLEEAAARYVPIQAGLFERDPETAQRLRGVLGEARTHYPDLAGRFHVIVGDHSDLVPEVLDALDQHVTGRAFGLVYADPNGQALPLAVLQQLAQPAQLDRLDFLAYVSATNYKRRLGANCADARYLEDELRALGKPHIWIREPMAQHQWTFAICSAWAKLPVPKRLGFHRLDSPEGRAVMDRLNLSQKQRGDGA